jgi:hypothetical protein
MKTIELSRGLVALVDDEDFERVDQFSWWAIRSDGRYWYGIGYAETQADHPNPPRRAAMLHRFILSLPRSRFPLVDHWDGNGLNCQRHNLRVCSPSQNLANQLRLHSNNTSGFKGVWYNPKKPDANKFVAYIGDGGKNRKLGYFPTAIEAARRYDEAALERWGEFAVTNHQLGLLITQ